jgi:hypothetical protein
MSEALVVAAVNALPALLDIAHAVPAHLAAEDDPPDEWIICEVGHEGAYQPHRRGPVCDLTTILDMTGWRQTPAPGARDG